MLGSVQDPLTSAYDLAMLDLDGVVYVGGDAVPNAREALAAARTAGMRLAFITNNASRPPSVVARHLAELGIPATTSDVVTSAQAAAGVLAHRLGRGARVAVLGADGLRQAIEEAGLVAVGVDDDAAAIVTGYGPDVLWHEIMRSAVRIRDGLPWVASNTDMSFPTPFGTAPGHGVLVETLRRFSGVDPVVAGKPASPLLDETIRRIGGTSPLMVGDRLDTDIAGAHNAGVPSLLVLTGVTGLAELVAAEHGERPTYVSPDLRGLSRAQPAPELAGGTARLGGWTARVLDGRLVIEGDGDAENWWRVVATAAWAHRDHTGSVADTEGVRAPQARPGPPGG